MIRLFSKRHEDSINKKKIRPHLSKRLRRRIFALLEKFDYFYNETTDTGWHYSTSVLQDVESELCRRYGQDKLLALDENDRRVPVDIKGFVLGTYPARVFDLVEMFTDQSQLKVQIEIQKELNNAFEEEKCPWRITESQFFKVDSEFLEEKVIARSLELLKAEGYEGAIDELMEAKMILHLGITRVPFTIRARAWKAS